MLLLCVLLVFCLGTSLTALFLLRQDIKKLKEQIVYKNQTESHFEISVITESKEIKSLCREINALYEKINFHHEHALKKEKEMQMLISGVSHDMRTPLTSIQGYFDLLADAKDEKEKEKYVEIIRFRLQSLKNMLEDFFAYSKLNDSEFSVEMEEISIYPLLCKTLASYYYEFKQKKIEPNIVFEDEHLKCLGNEELLTRVFQNLISNVLKHGSKDLVIRQINNQISFTNGIMENNLEIDKIFDRFYKGDISRHYHSSGLGLANVKAIAEVMGWDVSASCEDKKLSIILILNTMVNR